MRNTADTYTKSFNYKVLGHTNMNEKNREVGK